MAGHSAPVPGRGTSRPSGRAHQVAHSETSLTVGLMPRTPWRTIWKFLLWTAQRRARTRRLHHGSGFELLYFFGKHGDGLEQVANNAVIGDVEDRSFGIFVDGDNCLGVLHANQMLNRA